MSQATGASAAPVEAARPAVETDLPAVAELAADLRSAAATQRGGPLWAVYEALPSPTVEHLAGRLDDPQLATIVGTLDDVVLAYGLAHLTTVRDSRTLAVVDELLVAEPARAVGLGEAVLAALVAWAASHDALGIDATALPGDRTAKNFFEAAGFTARRLVMHSTLSRDET
jgi:GNAT superfamily N-acetyltransferase